MILESQLRPLLTVIAGAYPAFRPDKAALGAWTGILQHEDIRQVHDAVHALLRRAGGFAPTPGDVVAEIRKRNPEPRRGASDVALIDGPAYDPPPFEPIGLKELLRFQDEDPEGYIAWSEEQQRKSVVPRDEPRYITERRAEWRKAAYERIRARARA